MSMGDLCLSKNLVWFKNAGTTFQRAMSYDFHDIKHIVEPYLDELPTHSKQWDLHVDYMRDIFLRCHDFNIHLNPHKCVFCVKIGQLLGFIMSKDGIRIDPLKIKYILDLSAPTNITKFQIFQGKENFLHCFVCNYVERTRGFVWLLKKGTPFVWNDFA